MPILLCNQGGTMEDPKFHWEVMGEAEGSNVKEVADNLAKKDPVFAKNYNPEQVTYWSWELRILKETKDIKIVKFNAILSYQYYLDDKLISQIELIEKLAKMLGIEIINEGDGTEHLRE